MSANNSATGGYLSPQNPAFPNGLTFIQFLQTVMVGISGFDGTLVRPEWQQKPPKQPDVNTDWLAFGIAESEAQGFPFQGFVGDPDSPTYSSQYHKKITLKCTLYGPASFDNYESIQDGFYLPQNTAALVSAGFGLVGVSKAIHNPELIDDLWFDRYDFFVALNYKQSRSYPILSLVSAGGIIFAPLSHDPNFSLSWLVKQEDN